MSKNNRLKTVRDKLGLTRTAMSKDIGIKDYKIKDIENGRNKLTHDILVKISKKYSINTQWLLTGEGSMFLDDQPKTEIITQEQNNTYTIKQLSITAQAGKAGEFFELDETNNFHLDKSLFKIAPNLGHLRAVKVTGDSMQPTLFEGDTLIVDISTKDYQNGIYVLNFNNMLIVKRLQFYLNGEIDIISDNPKYNIERYNPHESQEQIKIIGKKVLLIAF